MSYQVLQMLPADGWSSVYIDVERARGADPDEESLPLLSKPLVCWAYIRDYHEVILLPDGRQVPHEHLVGMDTLVGPDGDAQVQPTMGDTFVGYLHWTQTLETLREQARAVWHSLAYGPFGDEP